MRWQRTARLVIAVLAVAFAIGVGTTMRRRTPPQTAPPVPRTDPTAIVETQGGSTVRINRNQEEGVLRYQRLLTYANGASKMLGVTITSDRRGQTFTVTGAEGQAGENDSTMELSGGVRMEATDGMIVTADRATYSRVENFIRIPGAVSFSRGRMTGSGIGLDYNQTTDVINIGDRAAIDVKADTGGAGAMQLRAGALEFRRVEKIIRLDRGATIIRDRQTVAADQAVAHLTQDEEQLDLLELRTNSRITATGASAGGLESLTGRDVDLRYGGDGRTLQHANINGSAVVQLAGERRQPGRQISANAMDIGIGPDGATPTALVARDNVKVTLPGEQGGPTRVINAQALDGTGDDRRGLTGAHFTGNVQFAERGPGVDRAARSAILDVTMAPGFGAIEAATFTRGVRFADGPMFATAAAARYAVKSGLLELTGSEPGSLSPHVVNEQIAVDATRIDIALDGPDLKATGTVKSVLQPAKAGSAAKDPAKLPSMLKGDQPVNVTSEQLSYDGKASRATYTGAALLWQGETSIKGASITIDSRSGDLAATGPVTTAAMLQQDDGKGGKERVSSIGTAKDFAYVDGVRRATYTGDAHITGPQGDLTSPRIELFLKPSGDELDRAEAYDGVTLRGDDRKTTGVRLTFFGADQRYLVTGAPVTIVDECGRETTGRTLTFFRATDRIVVDGNEQIRTQTRGNKSNCP
ncbi:MAG TPA: LptA/OstA family protein [Vicinamibacterales bacterium]|nr:LptA/OstA family protein [Vicinamibacterales bacterium]